MITPHRITQVQVARVRGRANHSATHRTGGGTKRGITGRSTDRRAASRAQQGTTCRPVARGSTATRDEQGRRKTHHHCRAHIRLPFSFVTMETHVAKVRFRSSGFTEKYCLLLGLRRRDKGGNRALLRPKGGGACFCMRRNGSRSCAFRRRDPFAVTLGPRAIKAGVSWPDQQGRPARSFPALCRRRRTCPA